MTARIVDEDRTLLCAARARGAWASTPDFRLSESEFHFIDVALALNLVAADHQVQTLTGPNSATVGQDCLFSLTVISGSVEAWSFDPGDGGPIQTTPPPWTYAYPGEGDFQPTAVVTIGGQDSTRGHSIFIEAPEEPPPLAQQVSEDPTG